MKEKLGTNELIKNVFARNWKEVFVFDALNNQIVTYEDFFNKILRYKEELEAIGIRKNDTICSFMSNSVDLIVLYFAALIMQLTLVPLDPTKGKKELEEILSYVNYKTIISNVSNLEFSPQMIQTNHWNANFKNNENSIEQLNIFNDLDYNKLFLITFTSGSTGIPKGVMHSFNNLISSAIAFNNRFNFNKKNRFYHNLPMSYMAGILNLIILPFVSESKIVLGERFNVSNIMNFWDIPIKYSVNTFWFIPTIIALLSKLDRSTVGIDYANRHTIIGCVATAPLNNIIKNEFQKKYNISLYESYGLSETLFLTTNYPENDQEKSTGKILDGVELCFSDDSEIMVKVPWIFLGYSNKKTESHFKNGKYLTGDIGEFNDYSFLMITGRKKDLIIRGGVNISPKKIEDFVIGFNIFGECVILGIEDRYLGERIVCFFVPKKFSYNENIKKELNSQIIEKLGKDYYIDEFVEIREIPKNSNGKIDKQKIKEMYEHDKNSYIN